MNDEFGFEQQPGEPQRPAGSAVAPEARPQYGQSAPQGAPQYGQAAPQYGQNNYRPQNTAYAPPSRPPKGGKTGKGGGWITFLRVFLWIWFGLLCLAGVILFISAIVTAGRVSYLDSSSAVGIVASGFGVLLGCVLIAFLTVAGGMVALDAAANIRRCATNSARILDLLQEKKK